MGGDSGSTRVPQNTRLILEHIPFFFFFFFFPRAIFVLILFFGRPFCDATGAHKAGTMVGGEARGRARAP